jgi:hypothetical protein
MSDTLTLKEQSEIVQYIRDRLNEKEIDVNQLPRWLADLEKNRVILSESIRSCQKLKTTNLSLRNELKCMTTRAERAEADSIRLFEALKILIEFKSAKVNMWRCKIAQTAIADHEKTINTTS